MFPLSEQTSTGIGFFVYSIVSLCLTTPAVALRLWIRGYVIRTFGIDDWFLLLAQIAFIGLSLADIFGMLHGYGAHIEEVPIGELTQAFKALFANTVTLFTTLIFLKLSICFFYLRITPIPWQRALIYLIACLSTTIYLVSMLVTLFQCSPVRYYWSPPDQWDAHCLPLQVTTILLYIQYSISIWADWTLSLLPVAFLRHSQMRSRAKIYVCCLLGLGCFASSISIICLTKAHLNSEIVDWTYQNVPILMWSAAEPAVGILATSFAGYGPLIKVFSTAIRLRTRPRLSTARENQTYTSETKPRVSLGTVGTQGTIGSIQMTVSFAVDYERGNLDQGGLSWDSDGISETNLVAPESTLARHKASVSVG